jgi:hypothetical protein
VENTETPAAAKIHSDPAALEKLNVRISRDQYGCTRPTGVNGNTRNSLHSTKKWRLGYFEKLHKFPITMRV